MCGVFQILLLQSALLRMFMCLSWHTRREFFTEYTRCGTAMGEGMDWFFSIRKCFTLEAVWSHLQETCSAYLVFTKLWPSRLDFCQFGAHFKFLPKWFMWIHTWIWIKYVIFLIMHDIEHIFMNCLCYLFCKMTDRIFFLCHLPFSCWFLGCESFVLYTCSKYITV